MPLVFQRDRNEAQVMLNRSSPEVSRMAALVGDQKIGETIDATTEHAWLVVLGHANANFVAALGQVKTLVRIVSHVRARWVRNALGNTLLFDETGPFAGTVIRLTGQVHETSGRALRNR